MRSLLTKLLIGVVLIVPIISLGQTTLDNFNDGDYTSNPTWTVQSGAATITSGLLVNTSTGAYVLTTPFTTEVNHWSFDFSSNTSTNYNSLKYYFILNGSNIATANGYYITFATSSFTVYRLTAGASTQISGMNVAITSTLNDQTKIDITRSAANLFTIYVNGVSKSTFTDATYANNTVKYQAVSVSGGYSSTYSVDNISYSLSQNSLTTSGATYTYNFDHLPITATGASQVGGIFLDGWSFLEASTNANTTFDAGTGSSSTGNTYSLGVAGANGIGDRAFGILQSGTLTSIIGGKFVNNTGSTIISLTIGYTGEVWRLSAATDNLAFSYQVGDVALNLASGWNTVAGLAFSTPITGTAAAVDGNLSANRTVITPVTITGLSIPSGSTITIRWVDATASSSACMGIDDFTIIATTPTNYYWNGSNTTALNGTWDNVTNNWTSPTATATPNTAWANVAGTYNANFNSAVSSCTITIPGTIAIMPNNVNIGTSNYTFTTTGSTVGVISSPISLNANTLTLQPVVSAGLNISGAISGTGALIQNGTGTTNLSGLNTYSGLTTISSGILQLGASGTSPNSPLGTIGAGTTVSGTGTLDLNGISLATAEALTINGSGTSSIGALINNGGLAATWTGALILGADATIGGNNDIILSAVVSGSFNLTKTGVGKLTLSNTSNTLGTTGKSLTILNGTVSIAGLGALGNMPNFVLGGTGTSGKLTSSMASVSITPSFTIASGGGTLENTGVGNFTYSGAGTLNGVLLTSTTSTGKIDFSGGLTGSGGMTINNSGTGVTRITSGTVTYSGNTTIQAGTLAFVGSKASANSDLILAGGTLYVGDNAGTGYTITMKSLTLTSNSNITLVSTSILNLNASNLNTWTPSTILTINGWSGTAGSSGTGGKIYVGTTVNGLTSSQLSQIYFSGFGPATILSTGEIVPAASSAIQFRTIASGNWGSSSTWEYSLDGTIWTQSQITPTSANGTITIRTGHTVTIAAAVSIDQTIIDAGGVIIHSAAATVTLANGIGTDLQINGTWTRTSNSYTIDQSSGGTIAVGSGGVYELFITLSGGSIPTATWDANSILRIKNNSAMTSSPSNLTQTFGIVEINIPNQTSYWDFVVTDVTNELRVISTGSGYVRTTTNSSITGSFIQTGGIFIANLASANTSFTIGGNLNISAGIFEVSNNTVTAYSHDVYVAHDVQISGTEFWI